MLLLLLAQAIVISETSKTGAALGHRFVQVADL